MVDFVALTVAGSRAVAPADLNAAFAEKASVAALNNEVTARATAVDAEATARNSQVQSLIGNFDYYMARGTTTVGTVRQTYTAGPDFTVVNTLDFTLPRSGKLMAVASINLGSSNSVQPNFCFTNVSLDGNYLTGESTTGPTVCTATVSISTGAHRLTFTYATPSTPGTYVAVAQTLSYIVVED